MYFYFFMLMKKIDRYERVLIKFDSIIFGKLELSAQAKMSLLSALLYMEFSHWTFCGFYIIKNSEAPLGIEFDNFLWIRSRLNEKQMNKAAKKLLGEQDFSSFRASGCQSKSVIRRIYKANVTRKGNYLIFEVTANAFLLNMIRIIVGTLITVGKNEITPEDFENIIKKRDRKLAGRTIEAKGLYFVGPEYNNLDYKVNKVFVNELD